MLPNAVQCNAIELNAVKCSAVNCSKMQSSAAKMGAVHFTWPEDWRAWPAVGLPGTAPRGTWQEEEMVVGMVEMTLKKRTRQTNDSYIDGGGEMGPVRESGAVEEGDGGEDIVGAGGAKLLLRAARLLGHSQPMVTVDL